MPNQSDSPNYRFARFFLEKPRLTLLALLLLLSIGLVSFFSLKTTGFPTISIPTVLVETTYPGASAQTVASQVTVPVEGKLKGIDGISSYSSQSSNSFSIVSLSLDSGANADTVSQKASAALQSLSLPTGAQTPSVQSLVINDPAFRISIVGTDLAKIYDTEQKVKKDLTQNESTSSVTAVDELSPQISVTVDPLKLAVAHLSQSDLQSALKSVGMTVPIASDITLNSYSQSLQISLLGTTLTNVQNLPLRPATNPLATPVSLSDVALVTSSYAFATQPPPVLGYNNGDDHGTLPALTLVVTAAKGTDTHTYTAQVRELLKGYSDAKYIHADPVQATGTQIVEQYSSDDSNQIQVHEVTRGLIGGRLPVSNKSESELGWLLGGVQLVFLVMMALVSWRAAVVSSLAIPLSLLFSMIYLNLTGNSLNTIVLFSLVLAIGLVVDPALVVLEAIQRKVDSGQRGNAAVLAAVRDVGAGLFIATLNNLVVFLPFAVVSGIIGQIFANIPASIIPAIIGSYIVPLLFLGWLGGIVLRPGKRTSPNEEDNLWPFAKWLIRFNQNILDGSVFRRVILILVAGLLPLGIAGFYFGTGRITFTQFSGGGTGTTVNISGTFKPDLTKEHRQADTVAILSEISRNPHLGTVYATGTGFSYEAYVKDGDSYKIQSLSDDISNTLKEFSNDFFDVSAGVQSTTGPAAKYQVQIAVTSNDPATLQRAAVAVGQELQLACLENKKEALSSTCSGTTLVTKVNDGYTGLANLSVEVLLDRTKLAQYGLDAQGGQIIGILSQLFPNNKPTAAGSLTVDGTQVTIYLNQSATQPTSIEEIKAIPVITPTGKAITLADISSIVQSTGSSSITRNNGQTQAIVQARLATGHDDQGTAAKVTAAVVKYYNDDSAAQTKALGLPAGSIATSSQGGSASFGKSFVQLLEALALAIFVTYVILVIFFDSFLQPLIILFTIPLTFIGIFPALAYLGTKQFGFFEIIGMIILVGLVDNVAIFLIDAARQRITEGMEAKAAIAHASGIRLRPVILTKAVALASLAPLAILSPFYRSISLVIMFGLLTSGLTSLFTTPILFIFFRWLSARYAKFNGWNKFFFLFLSIPYLIGMGVQHRANKQRF